MYVDCISVWGSFQWTVYWQWTHSQHMQCVCHWTSPTRYTSKIECIHVDLLVYGAFWRYRGGGGGGGGGGIISAIIKFRCYQYYFSLVPAFLYIRKGTHWSMAKFKCGNRNTSIRARALSWIGEFLSNLYWISQITNSPKFSRYTIQ
jgi:hypothetical protein